MSQGDTADVVTVFLRNRGEVLLLKRSASVGTYSGRWGAVSGYVEKSPDTTAIREITEETGLEATEQVRAGDSFSVTDPDLGRSWTVHPYLFETATREVELNEESERSEWRPPTAILWRETVPALWTSYAHVRPTPDTIRADRSHGSAYLSIRALEVLRDEAGSRAAAGEDFEPAWNELETIGETLIAARPSMIAVENRVRRVLTTGRDAGSIDAVESAAIEEIARAYEADQRAAETIRPKLVGENVLTLSRSGTVLKALRSGPAHVHVAESRPDREGVGVAEELAMAGISTTLCTDAAVAWLIDRGEVDTVVIGADTILRDGRVVNKTGTLMAALVASEHEIPVYVVAAADKISLEESPRLEAGPPTPIYDGDRDIAVTNPTFDVTPPRSITGYATDRGMLDVAEVQTIAMDRSPQSG